MTKNFEGQNYIPSGNIQVPLYKLGMAKNLEYKKLRRTKPLDKIIGKDYQNGKLW